KETGTCLCELNIASLLLLLLAMVPLQVNACQGEELPRGVILDMVKLRILEALGMERAPESAQRVVGKPGAAVPQWRSRVVRETGEQHRRGHQESFQVILFPGMDACSFEDSISSHFTYYFHPSLDDQEMAVTSAHFWFFTGKNAGSENASTSLYLLTSDQELQMVSNGPSRRSQDGWATYRLNRDVQPSMGKGPFILQVHCPECSCHCSEEDKTPFLHFHIHQKKANRARRAPIIPWSSSALNLLQRPSPENADSNSDCLLHKIDISFKELGWENWIVNPKEFTFQYCHGTCATSQRSQVLGIKQCCAPMPGTMKSLRFTTTSDGGFSFKYETLPNIIPEDCTCI
uniref:Inhibin alpha chain n=1 Tax=Denticeps clupeoides TaxID=299321 RepID=A0AAY4B1X9_9TELE